MRLDPEDRSQLELEALLRDMCGVASLDAARRYRDLAPDYFEDGDPFWHPTAVHQFAAAWLEFQDQKREPAFARLKVSLLELIRQQEQGTTNDTQK